MLTQKQKKNRLKWAKLHLNWTPQQWEKVIWSDESRFEVCVGDSRKRVIRTANEAYDNDCLVRKVKFPASLMVWGCMSGQGVGVLLFIDGTVNAIKYREILENGLQPSIPQLQTGDGDYIFQQDGAACHTAKSVLGWMKEQQVPLMEWPSNSPDMSPIENLWGIMKRALRNNPVRTKEQLREKIEEIWSGITPELCRDLVHSMPRRMAAVIKRKGDCTQW